MMGTTTPTITTELCPMCCNKSCLPLALRLVAIVALASFGATGLTQRVHHHGANHARFFRIAKKTLHTIVVYLKHRAEAQQIP